MARNGWIGKLFGNRASMKKRSNGATSGTKPQILQLEDRTVPAVTSFVGGVLTVDLDAANEVVTIQNDTADISLTSSTGITGAGATFTTANVTQIIFQDSGNLGSQSVEIKSNSAFLLSGGLQSTGIETFTFNDEVEATSSSTITITGAEQIAVNSKVTSGSGGIFFGANNLSVASAIKATGGTATIQTKSPTTQIQLGGTDAAGVLGLNNAELGSITANKLAIGDASNTGGILLKSSVAVPNTPVLNLSTAGDVTLDASNPTLAVDTLSVVGNKVELTDVNLATLHNINNISGQATGAGQPFSIGLAGDAKIMAAGISADADVTVAANGKLTLNGPVQSLSKNVNLYVEDFTGSATVKALTPAPDNDNTAGTVYLFTYNFGTPISLGNDDVAGKLSISNAELQNFAAGRLVQIGDFFSGDLEVNNAITAPAGFTKLLLSSGGNVSDTPAGKIKVDALGVLVETAGASAILDSNGYEVQTFAAEGGDKSNTISFTQAGPLTVGTVGTVGGVTLSTTKGAGAGTIDLAAGPITINSKISGPGDVTILTDEISINATVEAAGKTVTIRTKNDATPIQLGAADAPGILALDAAELANITAAKLSLGGATHTGGVTLVSSVAIPNVTTLDLTTLGTITADPANPTLAVNTLTALGKNVLLSDANFTARHPISNFAAEATGLAELVRIGFSGDTTLLAAGAKADGNVELAVAGQLTANGPISSTSGDVLLQVDGFVGTSTVSAANQVSIFTDKATTQIQLGGTDAPGVLGLSQAELNNITATKLNLAGTNNTGGVIVQNSVALTTINQLNIQSAGDVSSNVTNAATLKVNTLSVIANSVNLTDPNLGILNDIQVISGKSLGANQPFSIGLAGDATVDTDGIIAQGELTIAANGKLAANGPIESVSKNVNLYIEDFTGSGTVKALTPNPNNDNTAGSIYLSVYNTTTGISFGQDNVAGKLSLSNAELQQFSAGRLLQVGDDFAADLEVNAPITAPLGVSKLILGATNTITQTPGSSIIVDSLGVVLLTANGSATLNEPTNQVNTFAAEGADGTIQVVFNNTGALTIGTVGLINGIVIQSNVANPGTSAEVSAASPLTIAANVSVPGALILTAGDAAAAGNDLTVNPGVSIDSTGSTVTLNAGDNILLDPTSTIKAIGLAGKIFVNLDKAVVDPDVGTGTNSIIPGAVFSSTLGTFIVSGDDQDTIQITPSANSTIDIQGGNPVVVPGDTLILDAGGNPATLSATTFDVPGFKQITFANFENLKLANVTDLTVQGTNGDDFLILEKNLGGKVQFTLDTFLGGIAVELPAGANKFQFDGLAGNDRMLARFVNGALGLGNGVFFTGNVDTLGDILQIEGDNLNTTATYLPGSTAGTGKFFVGADVINFASAEKADAFALKSLNVNFENLDDIITLTEATQFGPPASTAIQISGTSGAKAIVPVSVSKVGTLIVDTTTTEAAANPDSITVNPLTQASLVNNVTLITTPNVATGTDVVNFAGNVDLAGVLNVLTNTITYSAASMKTGGGQSYVANAGNLQTDVTFASTGAGNIIFSTPLDGAFNVAVNTAGVTKFNGAVGGTTPLTTLTTDAAGSTQVNGGAVSTTGKQTFNDDVTVGADTKFTSNAAGDITFAGKLDGAFNVNVNTTGKSIFGGVVGGTTPLVSLTTDLGGSTQVNGGAVSTTGAQTYNDDVTVGADATFASTAAGDITFAGKLDGAFNVNVNTAGKSIFGAPVGGTTPLASLTTDVGGTTQVNGGTVTTTGAQTYNDNVNVGADTKFTSTTAGDITFAGKLDGAFNVNVNTTGKSIFGGAVGGTTPLASLTTDAGGTTQVNGGAISTTGSQTYNDDVIVGADTKFTSTAAGDITFAGKLDGAFNVNVNTAGKSIFGAAVGANTPLASLTTDVPGSTQVNGGLISTTGNQFFGDMVTVGADAKFVSGAAGAISFDKSLDGGFNVAVNTTGTTTFNGPVGGTTPLVSLTTDLGGSTQVNGALVRTTKTQTYNDDVSINTSDALFTSTGAGADGNITFNAKLDGPKAATINTVGSTTFNGVVGGTTPLTSLTTDVGGTTQVNGGTVTTTGNQFFGDSVTVGADTTFTSNAAGDITFDKTLDGAFNVKVNTAGVTKFNGAVGGVTPLVSLTTDAPGSTQVNGGAITTSGAQTYNDNVTVGANTKFASTGSGDITFAAKLDGTFNVNVNTTGKNIFNGPVGATTPLASLTTDAGGTTQVNGGAITTTGNQTYNDDVTVGADAKFISTAAGDITFAGKLDGAFNVEVNTGGKSIFNGAVGGATPLATLKTDPAGSTNIAGGLIQTTGSQTYGDPVTLLTDTIFNSFASGNITFDKTLTGAAQNAIINTAGTTQFNGAVNVNNLTTDSPGSTVVNTPTVTATQSLTFNDPVTALQTTTFNAGANTTFLSTLTSAKDITVNAAGVTTFGGTVNVQNLTTDAPGTTTVATGSVQATQSLTFNDPVTVTVDTTFKAGTNVTFNQTLTGTTNVVVDAAAATNFKGAVSLGSLLVAGPGNTTVSGGTVNTTGSQTYAEPVTVTGPTTFTAGGPVSFQALSGNFKVTVTSGDTTTFNGAVDVGSLTTDGGGKTVVNTPTMTSTDFQLYADEVVFNQATTFKGGGDISFLNKVSSDCKDLVLLTPAKVLFNQPVSVGSISSDAPGQVIINGGLVETCNQQEYADEVILLSTTEFRSKSASNIAFGNKLTGAGQAAKVNTSGNTIFGAPVSLGSLETDAPGETFINAGTITTTGSQTYNDKVVISKDATLSGQGGITFGQTVTGAPSLTLNSPANVTFKGEVNLGNLTTDAGGQTLVETTRITTTGSQQYNDPVVAKTDARLTGLNLAFAQNVTASGDLELVLTGGSATQPGGGIQANSIGLLGSGAFQLGNANNDAISSLRVNMPSGSVLFRDSNDLTIEPNAGLSLTDGNITLQTGTNFTYRTPTDGAGVPATGINLGSGVFTLQPGLTGRGVVTFQGEIKASKANLGLPAGGNDLADTFRVRPSVTTPIVIQGNAPGLNRPAGTPGDRLVPNLSLNANENFVIVDFQYDGQNGFFVFSNGQRIDFFGIESVAGTAVTGFAIQTSEPGDATAQSKQPANYAVRTITSLNGQNLASQLQGSGITQNPFVVSPQVVNPANNNGPPRLAFGDVNGDGVVDLIVANGPGQLPLVTVINGSALLNTQSKPIDLSNLTPDQVIAQFLAYEPQFIGGVNVAVGDIAGTGKAQIIVGAEEGGGPRVRVFELDAAGQIQQSAGKLANFFAYEPTFTGGVRVAVGDVNNDGRDDLIVVPGDLGGPRVVVFDGKTGLDGVPSQAFPDVLFTFFAYDPNFRGGMYVNAGDFDNDGFADIITGAGRGGAPHVRVFTGKSVAAGNPVDIVNFFANFNDPQTLDPLFGSPTSFAGVGAVSFGGFSVAGQPRDILVSSPRGVTTSVLQYSVSKNGPTYVLNRLELLSPAALQQLQIPPIDARLDLLDYGATVNGFLDTEAEDA